MKKIGVFFGAVWRFIKRHKKLSAFLLALAIGGTAFLMIRSQLGQAENTAAAIPEMESLSKMDLELTVTATGTLQSTAVKEVNSNLSYDVAEVYVSVGDTVEAGQLLCLLDGGDLKESIADLNADIAEARESDENQLSRLAAALDEANSKRADNLSANEKAVTAAYNAIEEAKAAAGNAAGNAALGKGADKAGTAAADQAVKEDVTKNTLDLTAYNVNPADDITVLAGVPLESALAGAELLASNAEIRLNSSITGSDGFENLLSEFHSTQTLLVTVRELRDTVYNQAYQEASDAYKANNQNEFQVAYDRAYSDPASAAAATAAHSKAVEAMDTAYKNDSRSVETAQQNYNDQAEKNSAESLIRQRDDLNDDLEELSVLAPVSGVVTGMTAEVGSSVGGGGGDNSMSGSAGALFTIENANSLEIPVSVAEYDAIGLSEGLPAVVTTDAVEDVSWTAAVAEISPKASDGYFTVTLEITSDVGELKAGMSATAEIITESRENVFAVPYDAVVTNAEGKTVVYAMETGGAAFGGRASSGGFSGEPPEGMEGMELPEGGVPAGEMPDFSGGGETDLSENRVEIEVETGFESDYYIEISGGGLEEGMMILIDPLGLGVQSSASGSGDMNFSMPGGGGMAMVNGGPAGVGERMQAFGG